MASCRLLWSPERRRHSVRPFIERSWSCLATGPTTRVMCIMMYSQCRAVLFACERFHQNTHGHGVTVKSDHIPLEAVTKKPLACVPPRLQRVLLPLQKSANGIPLNTIEYHWIPLSTIGPFNDISAGLSGILNGNLRYHSIPLNGTLNTKYH